MLLTIFQSVSHVTCECVILLFSTIIHCDTLLNCVTHNFSESKSRLMWMCNFYSFFLWYTNVILYWTVLLTILQKVSHVPCECIIFYSFLLWYHCDTLLNCVNYNLSVCKSHHMWMFIYSILLWYHCDTYWTVLLTIFQVVSHISC